MKTTTILICVIIVITITIATYMRADATAFVSKPYNVAYDPARDPFKDLQLAQQDAVNEEKKILMILGGDWCSWCHKLTAFVEKNSDIRKHINETFVIMKVNVSEENENAEFLATLPKIKGYPFFVIADSKGQILAGHDTARLEDGDSYSKEKLMGFIQQW